MAFFLFGWLVFTVIIRSKSSCVLPTDPVIPIDYTLKLSIHENETFGNGTVTILIRVLRPTRSIFLQLNSSYAELRSKFHVVRMWYHGKLRHYRLDATFMKDEHKIRLNLKQNMQFPVGSVLTFSLDFRFFIAEPSKDSDGLGAFQEWSNTNYTERVLLYTNLQATGARRIFPCFDQPHLKATFSLHQLKITVDDPDSLTALFNTELSSKRKLGRNTIVYEFRTRTPKMSTYLFAVVVGVYPHSASALTRRGTKVTLYHRNATVQMAEYVASIENLLQDAFGVYVTLSKIDLVIVTDLKQMAMENWGLVISKYFPMHTNSSRTTKVIVHELVHEWFGNLVTCHTWNEIFVNEGLTTYFMYKFLDRSAPTEHHRDFIWLKLLQFRAIVRSNINMTDYMEKYALSEATDDYMTWALHYYKAVFVLQMLEGVVGEATMMRVARQYLHRYRFRTATVWDFFEEVQREVDRCTAPYLTSTSYPNVKEFMQGYYEGRAMANVTYDIVDNNIIRLKNSMECFVPVFIKCPGELKSTMELMLEPGEQLELYAKCNNVEVDPYQVAFVKYNRIWDAFYDNYVY